MIISSSVVEGAHRLKSDTKQSARQGRFFVNGPQTLNNYKLVTQNDQGLLFYNAAPTGYVNFTDSQTQTVAALGNAALFLGSLFLLGSLPARALGLGRSDSDYDYYDGGFGHRQGLLAKLPKLKLNNPFKKFTNRRKPRPQKRRHRRPFGGMRRLKKKSGRVGPVKEFTYRKKPMSKINLGAQYYSFGMKWPIAV